MAFKTRDVLEAAAEAVVVAADTQAARQSTAAMGDIDFMMVF
jgi:hypothetical protein